MCHYKILAIQSQIKLGFQEKKKSQGEALFSLSNQFPNFSTLQTDSGATSF
jgi:hypothetical protein